MLKADLAREFGVAAMTAGRWAAQGCPLTTPEAACEWLEANDNARHTRMWRLKRESKGLSVSGGMAVSTEAIKDPSVHGMLARIQYLERITFDEVQLATPGFARLGAIKAYNAATALRQNSEREIVELLTQMGELQSPQAQIDMLSDVLAPIAKELSGMSEKLAALCNPNDPQIAQAVLSEWEEKVKQMVRQATGNE